MISQRGLLDHFSRVCVEYFIDYIKRKQYYSIKNDKIKI